MAPATRSNRAISKPARKPRTRSAKDTSEWSLQSRADDTQYHHAQHDATTPHYNGNLAIASKEDVDLDFDDDYPTHDMAGMAESIGREVETFAEKLDEFLGQLPTRTKLDAVLELVEEFKQTALRAAAALEQKFRRERAQQLRNEWSEQAGLSTNSTSGDQSRPISSSRSRQQVHDLRRFQQEADIWELFRIVLELHHNPDKRAVQEDQEDKMRALGDLHRYTPEKDVWSRFLLEDDLARQRSLIKTWLEQTVDHQESDLPGIMDELESKAGRGKGLWSHGWMHTREKIKGEKRLRSWPASSDAPLPTVRLSDNSDLLVTSLDPDATSRQGRKLEKPDAFFERAMWISCWEMLRRGKSWEEVTQWCKQRNEGWRAISLGEATDPATTVSKSLWRNMCYLASQGGAANEYEAAVYGLLGGNISAMQKVSRSVDDSLYAFYNGALLRQFEQYLVANHPDRAANSRRLNEDALRDPQQQIVDLILKLRKEPTTSTESILPMKIIQSYLLANDLGSMIHTMGFAIAYTDALAGRGEDMIVHLDPWWPEQSNQPEAEIALDPQTLRIATHMSILFQKLTGEDLKIEERHAEENVLVAYIQALRAAGKRDLIPLYASHLRAGRYVVTMARVLEDVTSTSEQETMLELLQQYRLDNMLILTEQLAYLLTQCFAQGLRNPRPLKMVEIVDDTRLYPGQRIRADFIPESITSQEDAIIRSLRWYQIIKGYWKETFHSLSLALRKALVSGRLACALSIVNEFPYETISVQKAYQVMGKSINPMDSEGAFPANEQNKWELLIRQSKTYFELEHLVRAIQALADWRRQEKEFTEKKSNALKASSPPPVLRGAKEDVDDAMSMILTGRILLDPVDSDEATDLDFIRTQYIPEIIIAYNTVLHSAGSIISRDNLIEAMDLSVTVADEANKLTECFTGAGRMRELVNSFAQTSRVMLVLKSSGKQWKPRKENQAKDLGIWEIGPQGHAEGQHRDVSI